ncbi:ABC transporter permease [Halolamina salifodinae]|uniref:NitT/TauT family transport system permease protein n=1 Tax=Halolamina salifodinae TaxID=1202767 RepID=A0A8T4GVI6_9EURY|nr:ABC transporter permease [Halolamina salifodinae]MBP1985704.1 NitT/TauT family transport system permease protein [Halolamina salifodinae]
MSTLETDLGTDFGGDYDRRRLARGALGVVAFLLVWEVASWFNPAYVLPSPRAVAEVFVVELRSGAMLTALTASVTHWLPGTVVGTTLGIALGVTMAYSDLADDVATPLVRVLRPVPPLALIGFAIAWIGLNHAGAAFIIAAGAFWINYYAAYGGVDGVPEEFLDVAKSLGVDTDLGLVRKVVLPSALPEIITGIRTGIGRCWMLIIAAELMGVPGVGRELYTASQNLSVDAVLAYILLMSLVYLVLDTGVKSVQNRVLAWQ